MNTQKNQLKLLTSLLLCLIFTFTATPAFAILTLSSTNIASDGALSLTPNNWTLTLPTTPGTNGQFLKTDGSGVASWATTSGGSMVVGNVVSSGTAGSVLYVDGSGNLGQDNSNLFYDVTNHRLGLGTITPGAKLEIKGSTADSSAYALQASNSNSDNLLNVRNDGLVTVGKNALAAATALISSTPGTVLAETGSINAATVMKLDPGAVRFNIVSTGQNATNQPQLMFYNTQAVTSDAGQTYSFAATPISTPLGVLAFRGSTGTSGSFSSNGGILLSFQTTEAWSGTNQGAKFIVSTIKTGSTVSYNPLVIDSASGAVHTGATTDNTTYALKVNKSDNSNILTVRDDGIVAIGANPTFSSTAPTISSGFGSSPSITAGTATAFTLNVGTGGVATSGVIGLPTATNGWNCFANDQTTPGVNLTKQSANNTTTVTLTNYNSTTGSAAAWAASDVLHVNCTAF